MSIHGSQERVTPCHYLQRRSKRVDSTDDEHTPEKAGIQKSMARINKNKYKTQMCKNFSQTGYCPYRSKCQFAHGENQISRVAPAAKMFYRTRQCHSFWNQGQCSYGSRCQFSHYCLDKSTWNFLQICQYAFSARQEDSSRLIQILNRQDQ